MDETAPTGEAAERNAAPPLVPLEYARPLKARPVTRVGVRDAALLTLLLQVFLNAFFVAVLDREGRQSVPLASVAFWAGAILIWLRRRRKIAASDIVYLVVGYPMILAVFLIAAALNFHRFH